MIPVFILTGDVQSRSAQLLYSRFDAENGFDSFITSIDATRTINKAGAEWHRIITILKSRADLGHGVVVIKDTSVTTADNKTISRVITAASETYDMFHLCRWQDTCAMENPRSLADTSAVIVDCAPPDGVQAIYLSPRAIRVLTGTTPMKTGSVFVHSPQHSFSDELRGLYSCGELSSGSLASNLFSYNVLMAQSPSDYRKTMECKDCAAKNEEMDDFPLSPTARMSDEPLTLSIGDIVPKRGDLVRRGKAGWTILLLFLFVLLAGILIYYFWRKKQAA